jgi:APA family basic amino acid/polyamine antiporter
MRHLGHPWIGNAVAASAVIALPSVILMMMFGQTRVLFTMSRDGLMPKMFSTVHPKFFTPHVVTIITGVFVAAFAACFPVDLLADVSNAGTLFAFLVVAIGVMILRRTDPSRKRSFRTPVLWLVGPLAVAGCLLLFVSLGAYTVKVFFIWAAIGLVVYFSYARSRSHIANPAAAAAAAANE